MAGGRRRGARKPAPHRPPARPVLGNDPFERGAAVRPDAPQAAPHQAAPHPGPLPGPGRGEGDETRAISTSTPTPTPAPTATAAPTPSDEGPASPPSETDYARELSELARSLLPALQERLRGLAGLLRLGEATGPLDPHGMDPTLLPRAAPLLDFLYLTWWRVAVANASALPEGPVVVVANRGGTVPWDALVLRLAVRRETPSHRDLRPLLDAATLSRPVIGRAAARLGAVAASPESALELLGQGTAVGVFPEGSAPRPWPERYRIGAFGRGGFVKVALRARAAIVPCAVVGSEEASPPLGRAGFLAGAFRLPLLAGLPGFSIGPLGGLPLPSRWTLRFGQPLDLSGLGPEAARDPAAVAGLVSATRERLQALLDQAVAARRSVYL